MISTTNKLTALVFAVSFLFTANVQADMVFGELNFTTDRTTYLEGVHGSDWVFSSVGEHTGGQGKNPWTQWTYF